jgi:hypothetical protein
MTISGLSGVEGVRYAVAVQKAAQDQSKVEGTRVVQLIEQATPPPANTRRSHIDTYA